MEVKNVNIVIFGIEDSVRHVNANESQSSSQLLPGETHFRGKYSARPQLISAFHPGSLCYAHTQSPFSPFPHQKGSWSFEIQ